MAAWKEPRITQPDTALRLGPLPFQPQPLLPLPLGLDWRGTAGRRGHPAGRGGAGMGTQRLGRGGAGRRWPGTPSPFPVRAAWLFPNLPQSAPSRPGKAPRRLRAAPRCADRRACRDGRAPAGTGPRPACFFWESGAGRGEPVAPQPRTPAREPLLTSPILHLSGVSVLVLVLLGLPRATSSWGGGGLLTPSLSSFWSFSNLFLMVNF